MGEAKAHPPGCPHRHCFLPRWRCRRAGRLAAMTADAHTKRGASQPCFVLLSGGSAVRAEAGGAAVCREQIEHVPSARAKCRLNLVLFRASPDPAGVHQSCTVGPDGAGRAMGADHGPPLPRRFQLQVRRPSGSRLVSISLSTTACFALP